METKVRDLDGRLYLAAHLVAAGFRCCLGNRRSVQQYLLKEGGPFAYLDKGGAANSTLLTLFERMQERGGDLIRMDEEGGIYVENSTALVQRNPPSAVSLSLMTLLWGEWQKTELLREKASDDPEKFNVVGNPRFDLCAKRFASYFEAQQKDSRFKNEPYVLINTNFQRAHHYLGAEKLKALRNQAQGKSYNSLHEDMLCHYHGLLSGFFIEAIHALSKAIAPRSIVIRPHPTENLDFYRHTFKQVENIFVLREGPVQMWLINAASVIHHGCTTAVEAFVHGLPVAMYAPIYHPELSKPLPRAISETLDNHKDLINWVKSTLDGSYQLSSEQRSARQKLLEPVIAKLDGSSTSSIVELISNHYAGCAPEVKTFPSTPKEELLRNYRNGLGRLRKSKFGGALFRGQSIARYKFECLHEKELSEKVELLRAIEPELPPMQFNEVGCDAFLMEAVEL